MQTRSKTVEGRNKLLRTNHENANNDEAIRGILGKTHPLNIPEVTEQIFQFLSLPDIKNCRLVCRRWNQLAEKLQSKLSVVKMLKSKRIEDFDKMFPNAQESPIFRRFVLGEKWGGFDWPIHLYKLVDFFNKWQPNLSEITLFGPRFGRDEKGNLLPRNYNLSPLLPSTLRKLKLQSNGATMIVSTNKLCNLEVLHLEDSTLDITPGIILNNLEIYLVNVEFSENTEKIEEFLINPLLNFDVLKKASFNSENLKLDLQGSVSLDVLRLENEIKVLNWETSSWEIKKKLILLDYPGDIDLVKNQMKYKELEMDLEQLNVSLLPEGIEKLKVNLHCNTKDEDILPIFGYHNFPNLTTLNISLPLESDFSLIVEHFKHCSNLVTLSVTLGMHCPCCNRSDPSTLKTSSIPASVKTLHVDKVRIICDQRLELESLILHDYEFHGGEYNSLAEMARDLHVKKLVWLGDGYLNSFGRNIFDKKTKNAVKNLINLNLDTFVVGHFSQVNNSKFNKSFLVPLVDTQGAWYLFRHGEKGKAISGNDAKYLAKY